MIDVANPPTQLCDQMRRWRHQLHQFPELGFDEVQTSEMVANHLTELGLEVHTGVGGTGVVGLLKRGGSNRSVGLRADMDALSINEENTFAHRSSRDGHMHACGHDGHTSMLLGAATQLVQHGSFDGVVTFIFQPAEEHGRGAISMMEDGLFQRFPVDAVYALHNLPGLEAGTFGVRHGSIMACEDTFEIKVEGTAAHAAMPHRGIDPIVIGSELVLAIQSIVSRSLDPLSNAVISVTDFDCDATRNVLPPRIVLRGDVRSFDAETQDLIETRLEQLSTGICAANGASCEVTYSREFAATVNSRREAGVVATVAADVVGANRLLDDHPPLMASEDFGFMLQEKPGAYAFIGNGVTGAASSGLHSPTYDFNDEVLPIGAAFWTRLVETELAVTSGQ